VLAEQALRTRFGTGEEHADQLTHLLTGMRRPNVSVGVIPAGAQRYAVANIGFWIYDRAMVTLETPTAAIKVTQPAEVGQYERMFDYLQAEAVRGQDARRLVAEVLAEL